jgi:hypothetical protein
MSAPRTGRRADGAPSRSSARPWRTTLLVWLSLLAIMALMTIAGAVILTTLIVTSAPVEP